MHGIGQIIDDGFLVNISQVNKYALDYFVLWNYNDRQWATVILE